jgi:hypothetical protein
MLVSLIFCGCTDINISDDLTKKMTIVTFTVTPSIIELGDTANLSWVVTGSDTNVNINNGIGEVSLIGYRIISPTETTTYKLIATNSSSTKNVTTQIIVIANNSEENNSESIPSIAFTKTSTKLIVTGTDSGLKWADFTITGEYNDSLLGENVIAGDTITECSGTITIVHNPTNALIGSWTFVNEEPKNQTPNIEFTKTSTKLIVTGIDSNLDWNDFEVTWDTTATTATLNRSIALMVASGILTLTNGNRIAPDGTTIRAGDYIEISRSTSTVFQIIYIPTNSLIGTWTFV